MYVLCILDVQPGFDEAEQIIDPVRTLLRQAISDQAFIVLALFKRCGESFEHELLGYPHCKVWHTKKDLVSSVKQVLPPGDPEIRVCGLYTDLFLKTLVRGLSRDHTVRVMSKACYGEESGFEVMRRCPKVTIDSNGYLS